MDDYIKRVQNVVTDLSRYELDGVSGCWLWRGAKFQSGHAVVKIGGRSRLAHRVFYTYLKGPIPPGHQIHHTCHRPHCVNPGHLVAVTPGEHSRLHAKLTFEVADKIRKLYAGGDLTQSQIAETFGIDQTTVSRVVNGHAWVSLRDLDEAA